MNAEGGDGERDRTPDVDGSDRASTTFRDVGHGAPVPRWTWSDSWRLETRAYFWLVVLTTPVVTVLTFLAQWSWAAAQTPALRIDAGELLPALFGLLGWTLFCVLVVAVAALGGVVVSLPFTQLLGVAMRRVQPAWVQVTATSVLAGVLGAASTVFWLGPFIALPLSIATGAAGAIARSEEFRRRCPVDQVPRPRSDSTSSRSS